MLGFVGLGVMGEPMCRNLLRRSGQGVVGFDAARGPLERLEAEGLRVATGIPAVGHEADTVFLALPNGAAVEAVCAELLPALRPGGTVVDLGTSPVEGTRRLAAAFAERGAVFVDAPIARTRQAAIEGTLSIMVGADDAAFARVRPLLACMAADVTQCGPVGSGQVAKIMNNMVLAQTVVAIAEAMAVARRAGMDGAALLEVLSKGSADSFALRNHGMKAMVPGTYPERSFSTDYMRKDLGYALALGRETGVELPGAALADVLLAQAAAAGWGGLYWPVVARVVDGAG